MDSRNQQMLNGTTTENEIVVPAHVRRRPKRTAPPMSTPLPPEVDNRWGRGQSHVIPEGRFLVDFGDVPLGYRLRLAVGMLFGRMCRIDLRDGLLFTPKGVRTIRRPTREFADTAGIEVACEVLPRDEP